MIGSEWEARKQRSLDAGCGEYRHDFVYVGIDLAHGGIANGGTIYMLCKRCGGLTYVEGWWLGYKMLPTGVEDE